MSPSDTYPNCSQPMPDNIVNYEDSKNSETPVDEDSVVNVPMRISLIRELYNLFGTLLEQHS
jgi:hypothetical protein